MRPIAHLAGWPGNVKVAHTCLNMIQKCLGRSDCLNFIVQIMELSCRTIGDRHAGARVTAEPSVSQVSVDHAGARVILASDGLWDAFNNNGKSVCQRVRDLQHTKAAARLRSAAKDKRDRDDVTVICCDLLPDTSVRIPPALNGKQGQQSCQVVLVVLSAIQLNIRLQVMLPGPTDMTV